MKDNLVSVIIPMFNSEGTIVKCIKSVVDQTYKNYEIIIVDDGSVDNSYNIVKEYLEKNIKNNYILVKQENQGPAKARNYGISLSNGKYIAFLDSDDVWISSKLEKQIDIMKKDNNITLIGSNINNIVYKNKENLLNITFAKMLIKNYFFTPTVLIKKEVFNKLKYNEEKKYSEDYDLFLRISYSSKCVLINESLVICGDLKRTFGESGLSSKLWLMEKGELSNFITLFKEKKINIFQLSYSLIYSLIKFIRRVIISKLKF